MTEIYALSQLIKAHPLYTVHRDEIHQIFLRLARLESLTDLQLRQSLQEYFPALGEFIEKNHMQFKAHCAELLQWQMQGVQFVTYGESLYPSQCYRMADPPLTLSYRGSPAWMIDRSISIVGSREPSSESLRWMEQELAAFLELQLPFVVSGGARGVDQKAHSLALRKSCQTAVILPSGLGEIYPSSLLDWITPVLDQGGCFLSEYDPKQMMHKRLFHHRNRLIAALGSVTLLVEARRRSGTLITAHQAAELSRPVWVVPGHPLDPHFLGGLDLLLDGAQLVRDAQDLSTLFHSELLFDKFQAADIGGCPGSGH
ncbi:DNA-processing protein DprA [Bdellovibrio sp. HCB290]|uniref:DNA-processing protein DprA n=1 Tax=Bdellovibrio sp. HCB290 TaxID=3394356 RepID=UPI0039B3DC48